MRAWGYVLIAAFILSSDVAFAVREDTANPDSVLQDRDMRGVSAQEYLHREELRRAEAEKRAEKIRDLPPESVQDWINGKLSEADLDRLTSTKPSQEPVVTVAVPRERLNRLLLVSGAVLVLAFLYGLQRRRARLEAVPKAKKNVS